jgi:hypothetical protein
MSVVRKNEKPIPDHGQRDARAPLKPFASAAERAKRRFFAEFATILDN